MIFIIGTLIWTYSSGLLDVTRLKLENEKTLLQIEKSQLALDIQNFQNKRQSILDSLIKLNQKLDRAKNAQKEAQRKNEELIAKLSKEEKCEFYKKQRDSLLSVLIQQKAVNYMLTEDDKIILNEDGTPMLWQ